MVRPSAEQVAQHTQASGRHEQHLDEARRAARREEHEERRDGARDGRDPDRRDGDRDGFMVDPDALSDYAERARTIADELAELRGHQLRGMRALTDDSFGRIGAETGFAAALDRFGQALQHQLRGVGRNADTLARSVSRTARHHREQEQDIAQDLLQLLQDK